MLPMNLLQTSAARSLTLLAATAATGMETAPANAQTPHLGDQAPRANDDRIARQGDGDDDDNTEAAFDWNGLR